SPPPRPPSRPTLPGFPGDGAGALEAPPILQKPPSAKMRKKPNPLSMNGAFGKGNAQALAPSPEEMAALKKVWQGTWDSPGGLLSPKGVVMGAELHLTLDPSG